jgi:hypothetical protein
MTLTLNFYVMFWLIEGPWGDFFVGYYQYASGVSA